jgi:hypothetical protein
MAEAKKEKKSFEQRVAQLVKDFLEWAAETFADAELTELRADLGLDPAGAAPQLDPAHKAKIDEFVAKQAKDMNKAALVELGTSLATLAGPVLAFIDAAKKDNVDTQTVFWLLFRIFALDALRVRNPSGYALVRLLGFVAGDEEMIAQLDAAPLTQLLRGEGPAADGEALMQRWSMLGGVAVVVAATQWKKLDGLIDALYGWDPDPEDPVESAVIASRALTIVLDRPVSPTVRPALTVIAVPKGHKGPGLYVGATAGLNLPMDVGDLTYTMDIAGAARFGLFVPLDTDLKVRAFAGFEPSIRLTVEPRKELDLAAAPIVRFGSADGTRLQIGAFSIGTELTKDRAAFRLGVRKGLLVIALGQGDAFLRQLPGGNIEIPFDLGFLADTAAGLRLEGGTGLRVSLPVNASLFGVFTIQFLELELLLQDAIKLDLRGGFSLRLGPFQASIDRAGMTLDLEKLTDLDKLSDLASFAPPKGIGLTLDIGGVVKGGGYLYIDAARGEYAGALELKFATWSIKALGLLSTKRPDGREGWSLLLFVFGQFVWPIGSTGIFWTGLGGMIGLHHRADVDALTAGMKTGALDDILFPENPIADAPRIINRYRTLFPIEPNNLIVGPTLELSLLQPPTVYVRLGLIFDVRNALGGSAPTALSKVILIGQILAQMPPKATGAPAVLKLLVDVVGFYDADTKFLLIRARLRDSFAGLEHVGKVTLSGELLVAVDFAAGSNFVISAGGFHPKYTGLPARIPPELERLQAGFKLGPVKLTLQLYFAVTPNSVQAGAKISLTADFGVASIEASLSFNALLYLSPRFHFIIDIDFRAKVKAFGRTLASVGVTATLEGPDRWHIKGEFSFSILWWDKTVGFEERWGEVEAADPGTASLGQALRAELSNPDNLLPEAPAAGSIVTLAPPGATVKLAHPLGRLSVRQKVVPFGLRVDRLGIKRLTGGATTVSVHSVALNDVGLPSFESTTEQFARGQFTELTETEKLTGKVLETFPSGVVVGRTDFATPPLARDVTASFETVRLDPRPKGVITKWAAQRMKLAPVGFASALTASRLGAAARSERAERVQRRAGKLATVSVQEPPLALADPVTLKETATLVGAAKHSVSLAGQASAASGQRLVESFELMP